MNTGLTFLLVVFVLVLFGVVYDRLIGYVEQLGWLEGFTSLSVVGGVLVTLLAAGLVVGWEVVLVVLVCFAASGVPMVVGAWVRYVRRRNCDLEGMRMLFEQECDPLPRNTRNEPRNTRNTRNGVAG